MKFLLGATSAAISLALIPAMSVAQTVTPATPAAEPAPAATTAPAADATAAATVATPATGANLVAAAKANPDLSTFVELAASANLTSTLEGTGPLTVLAPTNAAFAKVPQAQLDELKKPANAAKLQQVLLYHVIPGPAPSSALKGTSGDVPTAAGTSTVKVDGTGDVLKINGANVTRADVAASNGAIHVIDTVLMPPAA